MTELGRMSCTSVWLAALIASVVPGNFAAAAAIHVQATTAKVTTAARPVNPADTATLEEFTRRLGQYVDLQGRLAKQSPKLKETNNPADITRAQDALAASIQAARRQARRGDIFTPEVATLFRRLMYPELTGQSGQNTRGNIDDEQASIALKVNARYPGTEPFQTLPPNILASLPPLPADLEYRMVGRHLVLRDVDANIIIDFIPNAIRS